MPHRCRDPPGPLGSPRRVGARKVGPRCLDLAGGARAWTDGGPRLLGGITRQAREGPGSAPRVY